MRITLSLIICLLFASCQKTDQEKLNVILNSKELMIRVNTYGGIGGYNEQNFHLKNSGNEIILIVDEGTDFQTFIRIDDRKIELLKKFITESYKTHNPTKEMSSSCLTGLDTEYIFKKGLTKLSLQPNKTADSLFNRIINAQ